MFQIIWDLASRFRHSTAAPVVEKGPAQQPTYELTQASLPSLEGTLEGSFRFVDLIHSQLRGSQSEPSRELEHARALFAQITAIDPPLGSWSAPQETRAYAAQLYSFLPEEEHSRWMIKQVQSRASISITGGFRPNHTFLVSTDDTPIVADLTWTQFLRSPKFQPLLPSILVGDRARLESFYERISSGVYPSLGERHGNELRLPKSSVDFVRSHYGFDDWQQESADITQSALESYFKLRDRFAN